MPVNCIRCRGMIPQADITARMTAKDPQGNFFCAKCTVELAAQMGVKLGSSNPALPPAGPPGKTLILTRPPQTTRIQTTTTQTNPPRPGTPGRTGSTGRVPVLGPGQRGAAPPPKGSSSQRIPVQRAPTATRPGMAAPPKGSSSQRIPVQRAPTATRPGMAAPPKGSSSQRIPVQRGPSSSRMGTVPPARAGSSGRVPTVQRGPSSARMRPATAVRPGSSAMRPAEPMEEGDIPLDEGDGLPPPWWKNRTKLIAVVAVAAILGLIALLALYMAGQQREQEEQQQRRVAAKKAYTEMVEFAKEKPRDYAGRTALAKALEEKAKGYPDFEGAAKQEFAAIEAEQKREVTYKQAAADLNALERDADDPKLAKEVLSKAEALAGRLDPRNTEDQKRLTVILKKSGDFKAWATFNDALEFAKTNASNIDAILSKYDEVMEEAVKNGSAEVHRAAMEEIDRHSQAKYTAEFEGKQPLLDLLEGGAKEQWKVWQENTLDILTEGGSWVLAAKDTGPGVIFTGLDKGWRDFVAEIEFTIEKKGFTFYGRAGRGNEVRYAVEADGPAGLKAGQPYKVKIAIKALHGQAEFADLGVDDFSKKVGLAPLAGGIGLALDTGAKVKFKSIKLRVLRSK